MKQLLRNYSIVDINNDLAKLVSNKVVNTFKLFSMKDEGKLSVTLSPIENYKDRYHGLHPMFDESFLRMVLQEFNLNTSKEFWDSVIKIQSEYEVFDLLYDDRIDSNDLNNITFLKIACLGKAILQMISRYGFILVCSKNTADNFRQDLKEICDKLDMDQNMLARYSVTKNNNHIKLIGIWSDEVIKYMTNRYSIDDLSDKLIHIDKGIITKNNKLGDLLTFNNLETFEFVNEGVYYSGVMPRVMKLEYMHNQASNASIKQLTFNVCRTTFATVDMMDNSGVLKHPYFNDTSLGKYYKGMLIELDLYEDRAQDEHLYSEDKNRYSGIYEQRDYEQEEIDRINRYLKKSLNTHTIAVSANLKTADNYLIAAQRGNQSIDANEFYCSANGQSEFMDKHVDFYKKSVFEDLPTMDYHSDYRVDLDNEMRREIVAELGISSIEPEWDYLGVSYLSINNSKHETFSEKRRMHFNVLMFNRTTSDFKTISKNQKNATESFENSRIIGIKTYMYDNLLELFNYRADIYTLG